MQEELCVKNPETKLLEDAELILYIKSKLNRPLRVCGMVKNVGEPGGGPFLAVNPVISRDVGINEQQQTPFFSLFLIRDESACFDLLPIIGRDQYVAEKSSRPSASPSSV
jgi:hypothetical protein